MKLCRLCKSICNLPLLTTHCNSSLIACDRSANRTILLSVVLLQGLTSDISVRGMQWSNERSKHSVLYFLTKFNQMVSFYFSSRYWLMCKIHCRCCCKVVFDLEYLMNWKIKAIEYWFMINRFIIFNKERNINRRLSLKRAKPWF